MEGVCIIQDKDTMQGKELGCIIFRETEMAAVLLCKLHDGVYLKRPLRGTIVEDAEDASRDGEEKRLFQNAKARTRRVWGESKH